MGFLVAGTSGIRGGSEFCSAIRPKKDTSDEIVEKKKFVGGLSGSEGMDEEPKETRGSGSDRWENKDEEENKEDEEE